MSLIGTLWMKVCAPNTYEIFRVSSTKGDKATIEKLNPATMSKVGRARSVKKSSFEADNWKRSGFFPYVK